MQITISYHWWMIPTLLTASILVWAFWPSSHKSRSTSSWFDFAGLIDSLFKVAIALFLLNIIWIITAILK